MNTKLKSLPGIGCLALKLLLTGCLATAAQGAGVFTSTGSLNTAREEHTATLLPNGKVLVAAGYDGYSWVSSDLLASAELYDPSTGNWSPTGSLNTARSGHTATLLPSGQALIVGGYNIDAYSNAVELASAELYDPATGIWTPTGNLTDARHYHTATLLPNGQVLVAGGLDEFGISASAELYDPATGVWTPTGSLTDVRVNHTATLMANGLDLVAGGEDNDDYFASAES
jgi:N-acetylneuraminic acid mutarotase